MNNQLESRFITYPDTLPKSTNHTVLIVDAELEDVANLATFCSISQRNYDIYLYKGEQDDLAWLNHVGNIADYVFVHKNSQVKITDSHIYGGVEHLKDYFVQFDTYCLTTA